MMASYRAPPRRAGAMPLPLGGRGSPIRTGDLLLPKQAHYQTVLCPDDLSLAGLRYQDLDLGATVQPRRCAPSASVDTRGPVFRWRQVMTERQEHYRDMLQLVRGFMPHNPLEACERLEEL